jgi:hypothetical protein
MTEDTRHTTADDDRSPEFTQVNLKYSSQNHVCQHACHGQETTR